MWFKNGSILQFGIKALPICWISYRINASAIRNFFLWLFFLYAVAKVKTFIFLLCFLFKVFWPISTQYCSSYRNQSSGLYWKLNDRFLCETQNLAESGNNFVSILKAVTSLPSQPAFTCSKLTTETLEESVKYVQVNNKDTRMTPMGVFNVTFEHISHLVLVFLLLTLSRQMSAGQQKKVTFPSFWRKFTLSPKWSVITKRRVLDFSSQEQL